MEDVSAFLNRLKLAVETSEEDIVQEFVSDGPFSTMIAELCRMMQEACLGNTFPLEIGRVRTLSDGRVKVVVYISEARNRFVFTLEPSNNSWKISHIEGVLIPLFEVPYTPYYDILRLEEEQRAWISAETEVSFMSRVYAELKEKGGKEYAQRFFWDGGGYRIAMDAWLPFIEGPAQFVTFTAIMEANLRGSKCTINETNDGKWVLEMRPMAHLEVLKRAILHPRFSYDEYKDLYTSVIKDRAKHCNITIEIEFNDTNCTLMVTPKQLQCA